MDLVCAHFEAVSRGEIRDLVVAVPPGTSKSTIASVLYPTWDWIATPWRKFISATYAEKLSWDFARRSLELIESEWYRERWPHVEVKPGDRVGLYINTLGGQRFSTMMGGEATGRHAHTLLIDDPTKPSSLEVGGDSAKAELDKTWERVTGTFSRRVADASKFARICIMQRLHEEDVAGRMIRSPKTVHLCLPMEFEPERAYRSEWGDDWRVEPGELLCPLRFPAHYIDDIKNSPTGLSARSYAAQMQQRPAPQAGAIFQRESFQQRWTHLPPAARWMMSIDSSLKADKHSDWNVLQVWAWLGSQYYLVEQRRLRAGFSEIVRVALELKQVYSQIRQVLVEDKANGPAIVSQLKQHIPGVYAVNPEGGKIARANAVEPILRAGNVWLPDKPWVGDLVEECVSFPVGANDDQVDAMTQALLEMSGRKRSDRLRRAMANTRARMQRMGY